MSAQTSTPCLPTRSSSPSRCAAARGRAEAPGQRGRDGCPRRAEGSRRRPRPAGPPHGTRGGHRRAQATRLRPPGKRGGEEPDSARAGRGLRRRHRPPPTMSRLWPHDFHAARFAMDEGPTGARRPRCSAATSSGATRRRRPLRDLRCIMRDLIGSAPASGSDCARTRGHREVGAPRSKRRPEPPR